MPTTKPIVLHTGRSYTVEERRKRAEEENIYRVNRLGLVPPDELNERAKLKFEQIANEAFWLDSLSVDFLAAYCQAWDRWLTIVETMNDTSDVVLQTNNKGETVAKQNPYRYGLKSYLSIMADMSVKLGLSAIDRLRLLSPTKETEKKENNPFEEFMAKVE